MEQTNSWSLLSQPWLWLSVLQASLQSESFCWQVLSNVSHFCLTYFFKEFLQGNFFPFVSKGEYSPKEKLNEGWGFFCTFSQVKKLILVFESGNILLTFKQNENTLDKEKSTQQTWQISVCFQLTFLTIKAIISLPGDKVRAMARNPQQGHSRFIAKWLPTDGFFWCFCKMQRAWMLDTCQHC